MSRYVTLRPGLSVNPDNICGIELHHIENQTSHYLYEIVLHTVGGQGRIVVDSGHARDFGWYPSVPGDEGWNAFHRQVDARIAEIAALLEPPAATFGEADARRRRWLAAAIAEGDCTASPDLVDSTATDERPAPT